MEEDRIAEEKKEEARKNLLESLTGAANGAGSFMQWIANFLKLLMNYVLGDTSDTPNEFQGDNEQRETFAQRSANASRIATKVKPKVEAYLKAHAGETVNHGSPVSQTLAVTSGFGARNVKGGSHNHAGYDLDILGAGTPEIRATEKGVVSFSGWYAGYGNFVEITHTDGTTTRYGHLTGTNMPEAGDEVSKGEVIGIMGNTGNSKGQHLHYEQRDKNGHAVTPRINDKLFKKGGQIAGSASAASVHAETEHDHEQPKIAIKPSAPSKPAMHPHALAQAAKAAGPLVARNEHSIPIMLKATDVDPNDRGVLPTVRQFASNVSAKVGSVLHLS